MIYKIIKLDDIVYIILLNALYFESFWDKKFDPKMTKNFDFLIIIMKNRFQR